MDGEYKLNELTAFLSTFDYPVDRDEVVDRTRDVTIVLADGEQDMGSLLERSTADRFESENDLETEVFNLLPRNAVGEPYQSEGEG